MIYPDSGTCQQQLDDIEAIDYFMASQISHELDQADNKLLFHLLLALQWGLRQGHSCLPVTEAADKTYWQNSEKDLDGYHFPSPDSINQCLAELAIKPEEQAPIVFDEQALYLRRYWQFEVEIAASLKNRMALTPLSEQALSRAKNFFSQLFEQPDSKPAETDWQKVAVANAPGRRLCIISGGPGTGKTYTVTRLLATLQAVHNGRLKILMAAPTGKAAQRLKESIAQAREDLLSRSVDKQLIDSIPEEAATLHRLLGFRPNSLQLKYNAQQPLNCDVLLIDEASMIDLPMMTRVLRALPEQATLILLGDADQLPSVETGSVLSDIACHPHPGYNADSAEQIKQISGQTVKINNNSHYNHLTLLTHSRRFGGEIGAIASEVINTQAQKSWQRLLDNEQQSIHFEHKEKEQLSYLPDPLCKNWLSQACRYYFLTISRAPDLPQAFAALAGFRILVPTRVGERGVEHLNKTIEQQLSVLNPSVRPGTHYPGRPIMVIQNSYSSHLFNGDVGLIWSDKNGKLSAWFENEDGQYRKISLARLPSVETVYAMTIHKTQGSEFNHVAIILPSQEYPLLSPELLYTGLTRAKEHLYIIGSETVWKAALTERTWRYSGLRTRLNN